MARSRTAATAFNTGHGLQFSLARPGLYGLATIFLLERACRIPLHRRADGNVRLRDRRQDLLRQTVPPNPQPAPSSRVPGLARYLYRKPPRPLPPLGRPAARTRGPPTVPCCSKPPGRPPWTSSCTGTPGSGSPPWRSTTTTSILPTGWNQRFPLPARWRTAVPGRSAGTSISRARKAKGLIGRLRAKGVPAKERSGVLVELTPLVESAGDSLSERDRRDVKTWLEQAEREARAMRHEADKAAASAALAVRCFEEGCTGRKNNDMEAAGATARTGCPASHGHRRPSARPDPCG